MGDLTSNRTIRILPAQYPMSQLYEWYKPMMSDVFSNSHVTMTDLSEGQNRIEIGVESLDEVPDLESILTHLGIPREAVIFSEIGRAVPLSHDLEDRATGGVIEGGYRISSSFGACTLGFNTARDGVAGFVTAGHCTFVSFLIATALLKAISWTSLGMSADGRKERSTTPA